MFSLRTLFLAVAYAALVCAALVYRSSFVGNTVVTITLVIAVAVTIAAWRFRRSFYGPVSLVLWLYMLIVFYEPLEEIERQLLANQLIFRSWASFVGIDIVPYADVNWIHWQQTFFAFRKERDVSVDDPGWQLIQQLSVYYYTIHCVSALLLGLLVGWITVWYERRHGMYSRRDSLPARTDKVSDRVTDHT